MKGGENGIKKIDRYLWENTGDYNGDNRIAPGIILYSRWSINER